MEKILRVCVSRDFLTDRSILENIAFGLEDNQVDSFNLKSQLNFLDCPNILKVYLMI